MIQFILAAALVTAAGQVEVKLHDGAVHRGTLTSINTESLIVTISGEPKELALRDISTLSAADAAGAADQPQPAVLVTLIDGSVLTAHSYELRDGQAVVKLAPGSETKISEKLIASVRFIESMAASKALNEQWASIAATKTAGDLLVVRKKQSLDYYEGVIRNIGPERIEFKLADELLSVSRSKVEGLIYYRAQTTDLPAAIGTVSLAGSHVKAQELALSDGQLRVKAAAGPELTWPLETLQAIDFSSDRVRYLSDLEPASVGYTPFVSLQRPLDSLARFYQPRRDRGFEQQALQLDGKRYAKGVCIASRTAVAYRLGGKFRQFKAWVGIDDAVRRAGDVQLAMLGDGRVLWQGDIRGTDEAKELDFDLTGVNRLEIRVDYGKGLDLADHLDLCDARMIK